MCLKGIYTFWMHSTMSFCWIHFLRHKIKIPSQQEAQCIFRTGMWNGVLCHTACVCFHNIRTAINGKKLLVCQPGIFPTRWRKKQHEYTDEDMLELWVFKQASCARTTIASLPCISVIFVLSSKISAYRPSIWVSSYCYKAYTHSPMGTPFVAITIQLDNTHVPYVWWLFLVSNRLCRM